MITTEDARDVAEKVFTYGDFAEIMRAMKARGWTRESVKCVLDEVFFESKGE